MKTKICDKCNGDGHLLGQITEKGHKLPNYKHVSGGVCFKCKGRGYIGTNKSSSVNTQDRELEYPIQKEKLKYVNKEIYISFNDLEYRCFVLIDKLDEYDDCNDPILVEDIKEYHNRSYLLYTLYINELNKEQKEQLKSEINKTIEHIHHKINNLEFDYNKSYILFDLLIEKYNRLQSIK